LTSELTGNLRSIKPEGNLIEDRYKSLQKRNVIETRVKQKIVRNNKKRKHLEKRNYKMGFSWEK
jgi:nucleolar protein 53